MLLITWLLLSQRAHGHVIKDASQQPVVWNRLISSTGGPHTEDPTQPCGFWCCRQSITVIFYLCVCQFLIHLRRSEDLLMRQSDSLEMTSLRCACRLFQLPGCVSSVVDKQRKWSHVQPQRDEKVLVSWWRTGKTAAALCFDRTVFPLCFRLIPVCLFFFNDGTIKGRNRESGMTLLLGCWDMLAFCAFFHAETSCDSHVSEFGVDLFFLAHPLFYAKS